MLYRLINFKEHLWDSLGIFGEIYWDIPRQIFTLSLINQTVCNVLTNLVKVLRDRVEVGAVVVLEPTCMVD